jgi:hypothetical protein
MSANSDVSMVTSQESPSNYCISMDTCAFVCVDIAYVRVYMYARTHTHTHALQNTEQPALLFIMNMYLVRQSVFINVTQFHLAVDC